MKICNITLIRIIIIYSNCLLPEILRDDVTVNQVHLRQLEEYQIGQTAKRREEIRAIEKEMCDYDERAQKSWKEN